ncbi:dimethylargininase [Fistulifera solaris]|uniref:Dimethylargininase n=1 Tax=Fistulifera solaris TaxID=1519565 RepID=A0A1Z5KK28_FISSO|nr:dimethylargininase [Fistulifera solaris]|eukprot:GAX26475.1 dimethylargininase [Fistulifera solaris]
MALARALPSTFSQGISEHQSDDHSASLNMTLATQQHESYIKALRSIIPVLQLPALPEYPDSLFVEDTVVAIDRQVALLQPGHPSRRGEVESVHQALQQLGMQVVADLRNNTPDAYCDGGDVMYTGRHLFIGLSNRTNRIGAQLLQQAFPAIPSIVIPPTMAGNQVLHLKSAVTLFAPDTLVVPTGPAGDAIWATFDAYNYSVVRVPDVLACNVVAVNGSVLVQDTSCTDSRRILEQAARERDVQELIWVNTSELAKKDAALTCCSVLLNI